MYTVDIKTITVNNTCFPRNEKCGEQEMSPETVSELVPDQMWVQCENQDCLKWRKVPGDVSLEELPEKVQSCEVHKFLNLSIYSRRV